MCDIKGVENGGGMKLKQRTIYYQDELHDEFAGDHIKAKHIGQDYRYIRVRPLERMLHGFWYGIVAIPLARLYMKLHFSHKIINKEVLKQAGNSGFYLYGNHTHFLADALIPTLVNHPRETAVIVHPNNVSMPVLGRITPYLGALPLPDDRGAMKHFLEALTWHTDCGDCIMIYPEAHIWPFYTGIPYFQIFRISRGSGIIITVRKFSFVRHHHTCGIRHSLIRHFIGSCCMIGLIGNGIIQICPVPGIRIVFHLPVCKCART